MHDTRSGWSGPSLTCSRLTGCGGRCSRTSPSTCYTRTRFGRPGTSWTARIPVPCSETLPPVGSSVRSLLHPSIPPVSAHTQGCSSEWIEFGIVSGAPRILSAYTGLLVKFVHTRQRLVWSLEACLERIAVLAAVPDRGDL